MESPIEEVNEPITPETDPNVAPLITISREKGSGGRPVAYHVTSELKDPWKIYDQDTLEQIARENEMKAWFESQTDEKTRLAIEEKIKKTFGPRFSELSQYYRDLITLLTTVGYKGYAVIVGRGGHILFPRALKIRLICALEQRISWIKRFEHVTTQEAVKMIQDSDMRKDEFVRTLFNHDLKIPYHYDMILRTSDNIRLEDASAAIVHLAKRKFKLPNI